DFKGHESMTIACLFTRDGKQAISCCGWPPANTDRSIRIWNVESGNEERRLVGHTDCIWRIVLSADGKWLVSGARDNSVRLWDLKLGQEVRRFVGHTNWVRGVAFAPDGKHIATSAQDDTIRLWDI